MIYSDVHVMYMLMYVGDCCPVLCFSCAGAVEHADGMLMLIRHGHADSQCASEKSAPLH